MATDEVMDALAIQETRLAALEEVQRDSTGYCLLPSPGEGNAILRPLLRPGEGLRWCCTHKVQHCSGQVASES